MEYPYSIKDLATKVNKTQQSLQKFIKKNSGFINEHTLQTGRFKMYDQAVMDLVVDYYKLPQETGNADHPAETADTDEAAEKESAYTARIAELEAEITAKNAEIANLKSQLENSEKERQEMIRQNGSLLLLLQEEKQEKMLLLPAPKKSFRQRLAGLFRQSPDSGAESQKNSPKSD